MFMFSVSYIVYFLFIVDFWDAFGTGLEEGDQCLFKDGTLGTCKFLTSCQPALESLQIGIFPQNVCGFRGTKSIFCCNTTDPVPTKIPEEIDKHNAVPGEISKKKCQEYSAHVRQPNQCSTTFFSDGIFASKDEFPHMVMLGAKTKGDMKWLCGGTLISEDFVLVAGHCLTSISGKPELARVGVTNLDDTEHSQDIKIEESIVHPDFKNPFFYNDIGLVKLEKKVEINDYVRPACLHTERDIEGLLTITTIWGVSTSGDLDKKLQRRVLSFYDQKKCNEYFKSLIDNSKALKNGITYETMLCAGANITAIDLRGGGPLQIFHKDYPCMYDVIGTGSFGKPASELTVFTRVSAYIPWIEEKVWK